MNNQLPPSKVVLNSAYATSLRDQGSTANFDLETGGVDLDGNTTICVVTFISFTALNTIFNITDSSNTIQVGYYDTDSGLHVITVMVDNGAYDIYSLVEALNTAFVYQYDNSEDDVFYTAFFNSVTGKVSIKPTFDLIPIGLDRICVLTNTHTGLLVKLGFDLTIATPVIGIYKGFYDEYTLTHAVLDLAITTTKLPDLYYPKMLYVCVDQIRTPNRVSLPANDYGIVLNEFAVTSSFGELIHAEPYNNFGYHIPNLKTNTLTVRIIDQDGNSVNWNDGTWILVLGLEYGTHSVNEDPTLGRTFRPLLSRTIHDPLITSHERMLKRYRI